MVRKKAKSVKKTAAKKSVAAKKKKTAGKPMKGCSSCGKMGE